MNDALGKIGSAITHAVADLPEDDRELAEAVAMDAANLTAMALAGQDVTEEFVHIRAQSAALSAASQARAVDAVITSVTNIVGQIARAAIVGI